MNRNKKWVAYLVRCSDNSLYCGISNDLKERLLEHNSGKGAKYTRFRRPVELVGISSELTKSDALKLEYKIKQLPAHRKIAELTRKEAERTVEQELKALEKEFKTLCKKVEKLTKAFEKADPHRLLEDGWGGQGAALLSTPATVAVGLRGNRDPL